VLLRLAQNTYNLLLMPRCSAFVVVIVLLVGSLTPVTGRASLKKFGKIKGRVVDINNARIARADLLIVGEGLSWRLITNTEGEFETALPVGEYKLSAEANGFDRFASQKFKIKSGKTQRFNIEMQIARPQLLVPASPDRESDVFAVACCARLAGRDAPAPSNV
jgi:hypothetical protein